MKKTLAKTYDLLNQLGLTANYTGFFHTAYAVYLSVENPEWLLSVTKWLYPEVAKQYNTSWRAVERNIRTAGNIIWQENGPLLEYLARRPLVQKPKSAQLLAILASSVDMNSFMKYGHNRSSH